MANVFSGTILDQNGTPIVQAQIKITQDGKVISNGNTSNAVGSLTNDKGEFRIQIDEVIDSKKITLTVTKDGKEIRSISNPSTTSRITVANLQIRGQEGGNLLLEGKYDGGKYYFKSLGGEGEKGDLIRDEFDLNMRELEELIKNCVTKNIALELLITGSESRIPNTDNEQFLPDGKTSNPNNGKPLPENELAKKRVEYLNKHITEDLFINPTFKGTYNTIKKEAFQVNGPPYPGNANYKQYQYVAISAKPAKPLCLAINIAAAYGEKKDVAYVAPGSKYCSFTAYSIPDRFGFNDYLLPYYTFKGNIGTSTTEEFSKTTWGALIYMYLFLKNNNSAAFLDVTTPGLKLNHKVITANSVQDDSIQRIIDNLALTIDEKNENGRTTGSNGFYSNVIKDSINKLITDYPNSFTILTNQGEKNISSDSPWGIKRASITNFFKKLIENNIKIAIIETNVVKVETIDITNPSYRLTPDGLNNYTIGISGVPVPRLSVWAYCICDTPFTAFN